MSRTSRARTRSTSSGVVVSVSPGTLCFSAASASPQVTSKLAVLTYESNLGSITDPAICFLNVKLFLKTLEAQ